MSANHARVRVKTLLHERAAGVFMVSVLRFIVVWCVPLTTGGSETRTAGRSLRLHRGADTLLAFIESDAA